MNVKQWLEEHFSKIDLRTELEAWAREIYADIYGVDIAPPEREYTGPERQLTAGTPPRTGC